MVYNYVTAAGEVGSGTPNAAGGRHFSPLAPKGNTQNNNEYLKNILSSKNGKDSVVVVSFKPRGSDGIVNFQEEKLISDITNKLENSENIVVLHIVCGSKTGLVYPSLKTVKSLKNDFGDRIIIVVDACQLRCQLTAVRTYTEL